AKQGSTRLPLVAASGQRLERAIEAFRAENARDPRKLRDAAGQLRPREWLDAERLAAWVERLEPQASEALRLASYCQHLRRWEKPRSEYEPGRLGYLKWRKALARFHAEEAAKLLRPLGYGDEVLLPLRQIQLKQGLITDPDVQTMEDALCLSFLEHELHEFALEHPDDKVIDIIAKTWRKMSGRAREIALRLPLGKRELELVQAALSRPEQAVPVAE
ncbi:MAG TPA: DUF4202 domain-containing protein, partial [Polyangiaceae bacterium]|nr:DUF4202 domain-containing protein [Polyangiaceae bacterium]